MRGKGEVGTSVSVMVRPEDLSFNMDETCQDAMWRNGRINGVTQSGETTKYSVEVDEIEVTVLELGIARFTQGDRVDIKVSQGCGVVVKGNRNTP